MTKAASLLISGLELSVYLGWPDNERLKEQIVMLDVDIWFPEPPNACLTDQLDDTICYSQLIAGIRKEINQRHFHLIEYLSREIYDYIKPMLPDQSRISVRITKHPTIPGLSGYVRFNYWDDQ